MTSSDTFCDALARSFLPSLLSSCFCRVLFSHALSLLSHLPFPLLLSSLSLLPCLSCGCSSSKEQHLVLFYGDDCGKFVGKCDRLAPTWDAIAARIRQESNYSNVFVQKINADEDARAKEVQLISIFLLIFFLLLLFNLFFSLLSYPLLSCF